MKCPKCGSDNPTKAQFCGICGVSLIVSTANGTGTTASELPMVRFLQAVKLGFKNYFKFNGRATRAEYWWWVLFCFLCFLGLIVLDVVDAITGTMELLGGLFQLAVFIPSIALGARRFHDINRTGWWVLMWLGLPMIAVAGIGILLAGSFSSAMFGGSNDKLWLIITVLGFAMLIGAGIGIIVLIVWAIKQGDQGLNKYGPDPRQPTSQQTYNRL